MKEAFILPSDFFRGPWPYIEQINAILDEYQDQGFTLSRGSYRTWRGG